MGFFEIKLRIGLLASALFLTGCGGGGDDSGSTTPKPVDPVNQGPIVTLTAVDEQIEQETFTLKATANDTDGEISSYSWSHDASFDFISDGLSSAEVSFTSPDISEDITVNFTVTVTDNDGASASSSQAVLIKRKVSNVTITGLVTDEPIANAELEIVVGGESFQVQANDSGRYTAVLNIDESSTKKLVRVKAKGLDALNPGVEFVSQLSSVEKLLAQAGEDNTLDSNDNFGVNITNVTTAEFALLTRDGTEPASEEELNSALLNVDADEKIQLATLIKIVVDNPDYQLPEGINSTLELVANEQVAKQFEEEVIEKDPEIIEKTKKEIKEDDALVTGATGTLEGNYIINSPRYHTNTAFHLSLRADGSGQFSSNTSSAISWAENAGVYTLDFAEKVTIYQNSDAESSESVVLTGFSFTVLAENDVFRTIEVTRSTERTVVNSNSGSVTMTTEDDETYTTNLIYKNKTISLLAEQLVGEWALHVQDNDFYTSYDPNLPETLQFYADGTGVVDSSEAFTWQLNSHSLIVNYDDGGETGQLELWFTKALSGGYQLVGLDTSFDKPSDTLTGLLIKKQAVSTTNDDLIGRWHGFIGTSQSYDLNIFSDGTMMIGLGITDWQGHLNDGQFTRKRFIYNNEIVTSCEGFDASCYLESEMIHEFISIVGNLYYIKRTLNYYLSNGEIRSQSGAILVYEYSKDLTYSAFTEELLENYTEFYSADGQTDRIYTEYDENGNVIYVVELEGQTYTGATFNDGVLSYDRNGETWHLELVSSDTGSIVVCHYQDGGTCNAASQITYLPKRPKVTLSANSSGNGEISPASQASFLYQKVGFEIIPDDGFVLDVIEGCDGYIEGNHYIAFASNTDCEITATFKEQQQTVGSFIIGNQDLYYASAYTVDLNEDNTGYLTYNGKVDITWQEDEQGVIEITPQQAFILNEYQNIEYPEGFPLEVNFKDIATSLRLKPLPEKGINWYELDRVIEQYKDDVLVDEYTTSYEVSKTSLDQRLAITTDDIAGQWSVDLVGEKTVYKVNFNLDGSGVSHNISDLSEENFTWQIVDNSIALFFPEDNGTESFYITKGLNIGYQLVTQGVFDGEHYTDSGIMVRRNEQPISADNFAGRHQFRDGHDLDTHWGEIQVYDDGEVFFTFDTSSFQGGFEGGHLKRDRYSEYVDGIYQRVDWCDVSLDTCTLEGEFIYTLVAVDGQRYFIERTLSGAVNGGDTTAHLYIHDYTPSTDVAQFEEHNLVFSLYQNDSNGIARWAVTYDYYDEVLNKQHYIFQIDDTEPVYVELVDGKLELTLDGQDTVIELVDNNRRNVTFCKYLKGNTCLEQDKVYLSFDLPKHMITVNSSINGSLSVGDESIVSHGSNWWASINPNSGYELDTISGCDGFVNAEGYYEIAFVSQSCQIDVTFKEFVPLSQQANITDSALAMCVDNSGKANLESVTELNCQYSDYGEITTLTGLEAFTNLESIGLSNLNVGENLNLTFLPLLRQLSVNDSQVSTIEVADPSLIEVLKLNSIGLTAFDLSRYVNLLELDLSNNNLTELDVSANPLIARLSVSNNELIELNISNQLLLVYLGAWANNISTLSIGSTDNLIHLDVENNAFSTLNVSDKANLAVLWVNSNPLSSLDLTQNTKLQRLHANFLALNELNLSNNFELEFLDISYSYGLAGLDLSHLENLYTLRIDGLDSSLISNDQFPHIRRLEFNNADLTSFDTSGLINLKELFLQGNQFTLGEQINIASPLQLISVGLSNNQQLSFFDTSAFTNLESAYLDSTNIANIDFSNNTALTEVRLSNSNLSTITGVDFIAEKSAVLEFYNNPLSNETANYLENLRNNQGYYNIYFSTNYAVNVVVSGNGVVSDSSFTLGDNETRGLSLYPDEGYEVGSVSGCNGTWHSADYYEVGPITESCEINVEFVEAIPLADKAGITDPVLAECVNNANHTQVKYTTRLACERSGEISSLEGLAALSSLSELYLSDLNIGGSIDLTALTMLERVSILDSAITDIKFNDAQLLEHINLSDNALTSFDVSIYSNLKELNLRDNQLVYLDTSNNTLLETLNISTNPLTNLVLNNPTLNRLDVSTTSLTTLNLSQSLGLNYLDISYTAALAGMDLSYLNSLRELNISGLNQNLINNWQFSSIESLSVTYAKLTSFDSTGLDNLKSLNLQGNRIADFSQVIIDKPEQLSELGMRLNPLTQLDISQLSNLTILNIGATKITSIDFSNNPVLWVVYASDAMITTITGIEFSTESTNLVMYFDNNPLSAETVSYLTDLKDNQGYNLSYSVAYRVVVNILGNGFVSDSEPSLSEGETRNIYLYPDTGYEIGSVTGCDGTLETTYYSVGPITESCEVNVEFVETTP